MSEMVKIDKSFINKVLMDLGVYVHGTVNNIDMLAYYDKVKAYHSISPTEFCDYKAEDRLGLNSVLPGAKSAVVIAIPYNLINRIKLDRVAGAIYGTVSNSAWEFDYHNVLRNILDQMLVCIKEHMIREHNKWDVEGTIAVDTSPLVDRILAKESGIGHYGKNTCIINDLYGTAFYIGSLILNVEISMDERSYTLLQDDKQEQHNNQNIKCQSCSKCVELCPGNALNGDYTMDVKRCISYLTQKKDLTFDEMKRIGTRIYGCDICQTVCPHNIKQDDKNTTDDRFIRTTSNKLDMIKILSMSNKEIQRIFKNSGFIWRGPKIIKRNCMIGLGNQKSLMGFEFIINNMEKFSDDLALTALWALFVIDKHKTVVYLETTGKKYSEKYSEHVKALMGKFIV